MASPAPEPAASEFAQLLDRARAGSREALGEVLTICRRYLLRVATRQIDSDLKIKGSPSDLVQETFLDAQQDFAQFTGGSEQEFLAWLGRILRNNVRNLNQKFHDGQKRTGCEIPLDDSRLAGAIKTNLPARTPTPSSIAIHDEEARALRQAVQQLPAHYRQVIRLRNLERRSFEEIAAVMDNSADGARKLWHRAMRQLANGMKTRTPS